MTRPAKDIKIQQLLTDILGTKPSMISLEVWLGDGQEIWVSVTGAFGELWTGTGGTFKAALIDLMQEALKQGPFPLPFGLHTDQVDWLAGNKKGKTDKN